MESKIELFQNDPRFKILSQNDKSELSDAAREFHLSWQDINYLISFASDLSLWQEDSLSDVIKSLASMPHQLKGKNRKQYFMSGIKKREAELRFSGGNYHDFKKIMPDSEKLSFEVDSSRERILLGRCPVESEKTRCCRLQTLDAVLSCGFDCSYCSIQSFYNGGKIVFQENLAEKLNKIEIDPRIPYHIGTGQSSDSLMWGNKNGLLDDLAGFARKNPNGILEFKTKSDNIFWFLKNRIPHNFLLTWSLNPQVICENEEHLTTSLEKRLAAARKIADAGIPVGFHFHPMVRYQGWEKDYGELFETVIRMFSPSEIVNISMGTLTFIKPVLKKIRKRMKASKILQMPLEDAAGKFSYPFEMKKELFQFAAGYFSNHWRENVFFYLCMEDKELWEPVFGFHYENNEIFEQEMISFYQNKIKQIRKEK